ncbi:hypothetical protein IMSAGC019_02276 [Lachnospiraceae bacterium]|nr:hypothetical protein IMSAGC019_02276 [Lachnospiraceae bacterium]
MSGIEVITVEELLKNHELDMVANNREFIAVYHLDEMEDYYSIAESSDCLQVFWGANSEFRKRFSLLDLSNVIELACGHGRHVTQYINMADKITLVDILEENILYCQKRFGDNTKIDYYVNSGHDLKRLTSSSFSALFTYDAMVHFEMLDIFEYLKETYRILKIGGKALFHHSNNAEDYKITFSTGTSGRNYMSAQLFAYLSNRAGLKVVEQKIINWGKSKDLDCITLVEK